MGASGIEAVLERHRARLMALPGVVGVSEGRTASGEPAVRLLVRDPSQVEVRFPRELDGHRVEVVASGDLRAIE